MDPGYLEHTTWALVSHDELLEVFAGSVDDAFIRAARYGEPVLDAYGEREGTGAEPLALVANQPRLPTYAGSAEASFRRTGLPRVPLKSLLIDYPLGPGDSPSAVSDGLRRAHAELVQYFPTRKLQREQWTPIRQWQTPEGMTEALISGNIKMDQPRRLPDGRTAIARGLGLLPHAQAFKMEGLGDGTLCLWSTPQCRSMCLVFSGQNKSDPYNQDVKLAKTRALLQNPAAFCRVLMASVHAYTCGVRCAAQEPYVRLNVYSDVPWEKVFPGMFEFFSDVPFYDYTKVPGRRTPDNYDLTFSVSGTPENIAHAKKEVQHGRRLCVVFLLPKEALFPKTFAVGGDPHYRLPVVDGTTHDVRPLDPAPSVIGLKWKPPFPRKHAAVMRTKGFEVFVVPVLVDKDGNVTAAETPRFTPGGPTVGGE